MGDLQRSSEVLEPSLESPRAAGATKVLIKRGRIAPKRGLLLASFTKSYANTNMEIIKGHLSESRQGQLTHAVEQISHI